MQQQPRPTNIDGQRNPGNLRTRDAGLAAGISAVFLATESIAMQVGAPPLLALGSAGAAILAAAGGLHSISAAWRPQLGRAATAAQDFAVDTALPAITTAGHWTRDTAIPTLVDFAKTAKERILP